MKPFIKWVGGKSKILKYIPVPDEINNYYEPFLGGGAMFFSVFKKAKKCFLSDQNPELINAWNIVKTNVQALVRLLDVYALRHSEEFFYRVRAEKTNDDVERAARFIYLNKACFNGLYRVNKQGDFNVPFGKQKKVKLYDKSLLEIADMLKNVEISVCDFSAINPSAGDFVYFDPPYHDAFTGYTAQNFNELDQIRLCDFAKTLIARGVFVVLSNNDTEFVSKLYHDFEKIKINVLRTQNPRYAFADIEVVLVSCLGSENGK